MYIRPWAERTTSIGKDVNMLWLAFEQTLASKSVRKVSEPLLVTYELITSSGGSDQSISQLTYSQVKQDIL